MKILDLANYPNLFDSIHLTSEEIENQIRDYPLQFSQVRNKKVEWEMQFPMFLNPFYKFIFLHKRIPQQNEFWEYYISENQVFFANIHDAEIMEGLKARAYRTYPSLVRDIHFSFFVKAKFQEASILYNRKLDIEEGIDLLITYNHKFWGINLYTDTARAYQGREKKVFRHSKFDNVEYVELPVEFKGSVKCGDFFLYGDKELDQIKAVIK